MTTDDKQTPDPTTPALLSAPRPIGYMGAAEIDALQARCGEYGLPAREACRVLASHAALLAHLDALTAPAPADGGEALGRMVRETRSPLIRRMIAGYPERGTLDEEMVKIDIAIGTALDAHGYARGVAAGETERARLAGEHEKEMESARASTKRDTAMLLDLRAEIARLTAERDAMAVELAEARAATARAKAACEKTEGAMHLADREEDKRVAVARRDGAREEREAIRDKVDHDARFGADSARGPMLAIVDWLDSRARGEGQGSTPKPPTIAEQIVAIRMRPETTPEQSRALGDVINDFRDRGLL